MKITIIGAGNGGQAIAGHMAAIGHDVVIYDRNPHIIEDINKEKKIELVGALECIGKIKFATTNLGEAIKEANVIMVATTANAHGEIAKKISPYLEEGQVIVLNPGRTCGAFEFDNVLKEEKVSCRYYLAEAQTLVYACRLIETGKVNIIGVKDRVFLSGLPASDTQYIIDLLRPMYHCFYPALNVLATSFENIGAMFHPAVVLFNEATIERGQQFYFYRDMTPGLAHLIEEIDKERLAVASAYSLKPISARDWVSYAYEGVSGNTLCERMQNNPAYYEILAPKSIDCRQITEDIPTGIIPLAELGKAAGIETPLFNSLINLCSTLLKTDFKKNGRTLKKLGLEGLSAQQIIEKIK